MFSARAIAYSITPLTSAIFRLKHFTRVCRQGLGM